MSSFGQEAPPKGRFCLALPSAQEQGRCRATGAPPEHLPPQVGLARRQLPPSGLHLLFRGVTCGSSRRPSRASSVSLPSLPGWGQPGLHGAGSCRPRIRPTASAPAVPRKEHLAFRGAASRPGPSTLWVGALLFPQLGSGVHVFGRLSLGLWLFPSFLVDGLFLFHSFITFGVDRRREA